MWLATANTATASVVANTEVTVASYVATNVSFAFENYFSVVARVAIAKSVIGKPIKPMKPINRIKPIKLMKPIKLIRIIVDNCKSIRLEALMTKATSAISTAYL